MPLACGLEVDTAPLSSAEERGVQAAAVLSGFCGVERTQRSTCRDTSRIFPFPRKYL